LRERILYGMPLSIIVAISVIIPKRYHASIAWRIRTTGTHIRPFTPDIKGNFITILDVFERIEPVSDYVKKEKVI
jgi:hypothetical protein